MPITATITKAELDNRTVASVVQTGITFNSYQTSPFFMFIPASGSDTALNKIELTVSDIEFGAPSLPVKIYAAKTNNYETIISESRNIYLLHSTTVSVNGVYTYSVTLTSGQLPPSDTYYVFAVIDDGGLYHTVSAYQKTTISTYDICTNMGYSSINGMQGGLTDSLFISETVIGFCPKLLIMDINWNIDRDVNSTTVLETFTGTSSSTKVFLTFDQYTKNFTCLSVTNAKTLSGTQLSEAYKDTNKIYLYHNGTSYPMTIAWVEGFGITLTSDLNPTVPNQFIFHYQAYGGHALQSEIVQSVANTSSVSFNIDPNVIFAIGSCGTIDGANSKRSFSTNNHALSFGIADRTTNQFRTGCYANFAGVCKSYIDSNTSPVIVASPATGSDNYTLTLDSFGTNIINTTFTGNSSYNGYINYFIAMHHPVNGKFQNINTTISSTSSISFTFSNFLATFYGYHNYSKNDNTCFYHDALSTSFAQTKRVFSFPKKSTSYSNLFIRSVAGYFVKKADLTQQNTYLGISASLYHRADDFITFTTDNSATSKVDPLISGAVASFSLSGGGAFIVDYNVSLLGILKVKTTGYEIANIYSNTSFTTTYTNNPSHMIQHDSTWLAKGTFDSPSTNYRAYLSLTIDMSTDDVLDITSLISSSSTTDINFNAVNTLPGTEKFYNKSTCYFVVRSNELTNTVESRPIIITTTSASDFRTYTNSFTVSNRTLIFSEPDNGFKFSAAILGIIDRNTMPYEVTNNTSNKQTTVYISYNYYTKTLKCGYLSQYLDDSNCRIVAGNDYELVQYDYAKHGAVNATGTGSFYSTDVCDFQYVPGEGLYMKGKSTTVSCTMLAFGGPSLLSDSLCGSTFTTSFLSSLQFLMNTTTPGGTESNTIIASNTNYSYGAYVSNGASPKVMCISNRWDTTAGGTRNVSVSSSHASRQQIGTPYSLSYSSRTHTPASSIYAVNYSGNTDTDTLYSLCLFFGSAEPSMLLNTITSPAVGTSSTVDYAHALTSGAQAVFGLHISNSGTSSPVNNTAYTRGSFAMGWGSINKTGNRFGGIEQAKIFDSPTSYYVERVQNTHLIKIYGQDTLYTAGNCYRSIAVTNFKKGAGPYNVEHSFETSALSSVGALYNSLIEIAIPVSSGQLLSNGPLEYSHNFTENMKFDFHRIESNTTLDVPYNFQTYNLNFNPVITPISLSYNIENNNLTYQNLISISPLSLSYTLNDINILRKIDITPVSLVYSFEASIINNVFSLDITPISLTYGFQTSSLALSNTLSTTSISLVYNLTSNNFNYVNNLDFTPFNYNYTFENNNFTLSNTISTTPLSLTYNFESSSFNGNTYLTINPISLTYTLNTGTFSYANNISITSFQYIYDIENSQLQYQNLISINPLSLSYTLNASSFSHALSLEQTNPLYLTHTLVNNNFTLLNTISTTPLSLTYTLNNIDISNTSGFTISPISISYGFEVSSFTLSNTISTTPLSLTYNLTSNQFTYNNIISTTPISLTYSFENNSISYVNNLGFTPFALSYVFNGGSFGGNILLNIDPLSLTYNLTSNQFTYNNIISTTPISLTYSFNTYYMTNSITLVQSAPHPIYLIIEDNNFTLSNTISTTPLSLTYNLTSNQFTYNNAFSLSSPISLIYNFENNSFNGDITLSVNPISLTYNLISNQITGYYSINISNPISLTYSFENNSISYVNNLGFTPFALSYTLNNINKVESLSIPTTSISNTYSFQTDMFTYVAGNIYLNITPITLTYSFGASNFEYTDPIIMVLDAPLGLSYGFNTYGMHVDKTYTITSHNLFYTFSDNMSMKADQFASISPVALSYSFENNSIEYKNYITYSSPLNVIYNLNNINSSYTNVFSINHISISMTFNDYLFFDQFNSINYDDITYKLNKTKYFVSYKR